MTIESRIEVAINEATAILAGLAVLRDTAPSAHEDILKAIKEATVKLAAVVDEISRLSG